MSELSELTGECQDCGEYNADCVCDERNDETPTPMNCPNCKFNQRGLFFELCLFHFTEYEKRI